MFMLAFLPRLVISSPWLDGVRADEPFALAPDGMWTCSETGQV